MRCFASLVTMTLMAAACRSPAAVLDMPVVVRPAAQDCQQDPSPDPVAREGSIEYEHVLGTGIMLRSPEKGWGAHLMLPVQFGVTQFDLADISLDQFASVSAVPTLEALVPLDERWTLMPFAGLGGAVQIGDGDLVAGHTSIGLFTAGVRVMRWQPFAERYSSIFRIGARYDAALTSRDGLLGDWGSVDIVVECRRAFGEDREASRFDPGIYAQGFWFWDPVQLEIDGVTPTYIHNQLELGLSLGKSKGLKILGISLPRVFLGFRFGGDIQSLQIRFGRL